MLSGKAKEMFAKLNMEYPAVAVKFCYLRPEGYEQFDGQKAFCEFVKEAQVSGKAFYTTKENDNCHGKISLGMAPKPASVASGMIGPVFGVFRTEAPNAKLHNTYMTLPAGSVRFVLFSPAAICDFDPDLVVCLAELEQADIIFRATSYISGDLWEQKVSCVMSCAWMYAYPYMTGKMNYCITGLHHGLKRRKVYPPGRFLMAIPFQKLDEVVRAMDEMPWELPAMSEDPEVKAELNRKIAVINAAEGEVMEA